MTQQNCSRNFLLNLSAVLAHTVWLEAKELAVARQVDDARNGGDPPAPTANETTAAQLQAFTQYLPGLLSTLRPEQKLSEQNNLDVQREIAPQLAQLNTELLAQYGPEYNKVGQDLSRQNAIAQAETDAQLLSGSGAKAVSAASDAQRLLDPEFYGTRENTARKYNELVNSYDPNGLSPSEAASIERSVNRSNIGTGNAGLGGPTAAIGNAFAFDDKLQQKKNNLSNVLNLYQGVQAGNKSGMDAYQIAAGKPSSSGYNQSQFQGVQPFGTASAETSGTANNFLSQTHQSAMQRNEIESKRRDGLDRVNETMSSLPNISV
jgi:hypothetical protein